MAQAVTGIHVARLGFGVIRIFRQSTYDVKEPEPGTMGGKVGGNRSFLCGSHIDLD
jgi:hypothetical protein